MWECQCEDVLDSILQDREEGSAEENLESDRKTSRGWGGGEHHHQEGMHFPQVKELQVRDHTWCDGHGRVSRITHDSMESDEELVLESCQT